MRRRDRAVSDHTDTTLTDTERDLASVLANHQRASQGMSYGAPDRCTCGAETYPARGDADVTERRDAAFAEHQASIVAARVAAARAEHVIPNRRGDTTVREWTPEDGDLRCQKCGHPNVVWFTDATTWNSAMGNEGGVLCIRCFIGTYESQGDPVIWSLWREHPGAFSTFSRGLEAGRASVGRFMAAARADERAKLIDQLRDAIEPWDETGLDRIRALIEGADQ